MEKYYCSTCRTVLDEDDIIGGYTVSEDMYYNDSCGYCGDDEIQEVDESRFCNICFEYHESDEEYEKCVEKVREEIALYERAGIQIEIINHLKTLVG